VIACAQCGIAIPTPTGRASRKRFCGADCRKAAWRDRHRHDDGVPAVSLAVPGVPAVPTASPDDVPARGGQHRCPHCHQPLAIISVLIPADAAVVRPPEVPHTVNNSANLNPPPGEDDLATLGNSDERQHGRADGTRRGSERAQDPTAPAVLEDLNPIYGSAKTQNQEGARAMEMLTGRSWLK
jgi:hypothetical protein